MLLWCNWRAQGPSKPLVRVQILIGVQKNTLIIRNIMKNIIMTKTTKQQLFYEIMLMGIACGLHSPQEWIYNYYRSLSMIYPYELIPQTEDVLDEIEKDIISYDSGLKVEEVTHNHIRQWYGHVYKDKIPSKK